MKKLRFENNIKLIAKRSKRSRDFLDYYLVLGNGQNLYAFTRKFSLTCFNFYKSGCPLNIALHRKESNKAHMYLIKYLNFIMPYLAETMELPISKGGRSITNRSYARCA